MSEPMTTREIEDVLSSIRRLVSDDLRPAPVGDDAARKTQSVARTAGQKPDGDQRETPDTFPGRNTLGKLLLTPALRVATQDAAAKVAYAPDIPWQSVGYGGDVVTRLGSGVADDGWEAPLGDADDWPGMQWGRPDALARTEPSALRFVHRARFGAVGQMVAPAQGATANQMGAAGLDASSDSLHARANAPPKPPEPATSTSAEGVPNPDPTATGDQTDRGWGGHAERVAMDDLAQEIEGKLAAAPPVAMAVDEAVVRNMVRALIREELAGALGERITRNVRKLVRAEIARALTMQDMD
jgi:hypothetical protein